MLDVEGFILVGGASSRMGADKSGLVFGNRTAVECIATELSSVASGISLVGSQQAQPKLGLKNVPDTHLRWGALGGIHTSLAACQAEWAAVVACDLPFVTRDLFLRLRQLAQIDQSPPSDAVVPVQPDLRPQPLCGLYRRQPCLIQTERLIAAGEHTPRALLAAVRTRWVEFNELADLPAAEHFFFNVNTPTDYEQAKQIAQRLQSHSR